VNVSLDMYPSLSVRNVTKIYRLYDRPSNRLKEILLKRPFHKEFKALDNISLELAKGETLGIIGENGAGKSTLLKILAKTLSPTSGGLDIRGKVSSLLELGSGFHPEFTGMENIFFYGALLGLSKNELSRKTDDIIAFAEIGDFIHYPLKTYSSGMYVRLAFSVATAIDPDILIVDEALSVGDLYFQKKSIDRILSFREQGKTIVFCSHAIYYINRLCSKVLWLKNGKAEMYGPHYDVTMAYERYQLEKQSPADGNERKEDSPDKPVIIKDVQVLPFPNLRTGDDLKIKIKTVAGDHSCSYKIAVIIKRIDEMDVASTYTKNMKPLRGDHEIHLEFPSLQLKGGTYFARTLVVDEHMLVVYDLKDSLPFNIPKESIEVGIVELPSKWTL
jgi:ABC-type polysaccharide/polyol phosphate transport system ATPase subunit